MKDFIEPIWSGEYSYPPAQRFGPAKRDCYIIHYVISGKGYFTAGGETRTITGGQAFIIYKGDTVEYHADKGDPWHYMWLDVDGEACEALLARTGFSKARRVSAPIPCERILPVFAELRESFASDSGGLAGIAAAIKLIAVIAECFPPPAEGGGRSAAERAMALIGRSYRSADCRIDRIGEMIGISRSQLYRAFVARYGVSPKEHLDELRIEGAKRSLAEGEGSVADVCYSSGFSDPLYFSALFKKRTGLSPSEFRARSRAARERGIKTL